MIAVDNLKMQFGSEEILKGISTVFRTRKNQPNYWSKWERKICDVKMSYWFIKTCCRNIHTTTNQQIK